MVKRHRPLPHSQIHVERRVNKATYQRVNKATYQRVNKATYQQQLVVCSTPTLTSNKVAVSYGLTFRASLSGTSTKERKDVVNQCLEFAMVYRYCPVGVSRRCRGRHLDCGYGCCGGGGFNSEPVWPSGKALGW